MLRLEGPVSVDGILSTTLRQQLPRRLANVWNFKKTEEIVKKALEKLEPDLAGSYFSLQNTEMEERLKKTLIDNEFVFDEQDFKDLCPCLLSRDSPARGRAPPPRQWLPSTRALAAGQDL